MKIEELFILSGSLVRFGRTSICDGAAESSQIQIQQRADEAAPGGTDVSFHSVHYSAVT